jgi:aldose 1-epimerase
MNDAAIAPQTTHCGGHAVHWLDDGRQRLGIIPSKGGGVAAWMLHPACASLSKQPNTPFHLWRPWSGDSDLFSVASLPLVPWSNRVSGGGFEQGGQFFPLRPNRTGQPYPIHGEGWLQVWEVLVHEAHRLDMQLRSVHFMDSPYAFVATQSYRLLPDGIQQTLTVTHEGAAALPYGLGQHPWLLRTPQTRIQAAVEGVWLCGADRLPIQHLAAMGQWDLQSGIPACGSLIDNAFTGWSGSARIVWPDAGWALNLRQADPQNDKCLLVFRPESGPSFCVEPVTHPVDAVHLPGQPGLRWLEPQASMALDLYWTFERLENASLRASSLQV